jgi:hypothetical protein
MNVKGEIATPDHYRLSKGKTKGTKSMFYYSIEPNYLLLTYFIIITRIVNNEPYKE